MSWPRRPDVMLDGGVENAGKPRPERSAMPGQSVHFEIPVAPVRLYLQRHVARDGRSRAPDDAGPGAPKPCFGPISR